MSFKKIIKKWPSRGVLAKALGIPRVNVDMWYFRDSIPPMYWSKVITQAKKDGIANINLENLSRTHFHRFQKK